MIFPKIGVLRVLLLIILVPGTGLMRAATPEEKEQTPLGKEMELISKNLRVLRRQIQDPEKKETSLTLLAGMEGSATKAKEFVPAKAKEIPENKRQEFVTAFGAKIDELLEALKKIETDVRESRFEEAKTALSTLQDLKRKGHEQFSSEKDN